jgi:hypothetical protein
MLTKSIEAKGMMRIKEHEEKGGEKEPLASSNDIANICVRNVCSCNPLPYHRSTAYVLNIVAIVRMCACDGVDAKALHIVIDNDGVDMLPHQLMIHPMQ